MNTTVKHRSLALRSLAPTSIPFLVLLFALQVPAQAQRPSPLTYDDPTFQWLDNRDPESPRPSPNAFVGLQLGSARVMVAYGSPGAKERKIFGGLVPYDRIWRTGANEATTLTLTAPILFGGEKVEPGTYTLFTIPRPEKWQIVLNRKNNQWGAYERDPGEDFLKITIPSTTGDSKEHLQFTFDGITSDGFKANLVIAWETTEVRIPLEEAE